MLLTAPNLSFWDIHVPGNKSGSSFHAPDAFLATIKATIFPLEEFILFIVCSSTSK